jgi:hypothetical protein
MRRRSQFVSAEFEAASPLVNKVFAALRSVGVFAKRRAACCPGCLDTSKLAPGQATVMTTPQREDGFKSNGVLNIVYNGRGDSDETTTALGQMIVAAAQHAGLAVDWNGSPDKTINVGTESAVQAYVARQAEWERQWRLEAETEAHAMNEAWDVAEREREAIGDMEAERRRNAFGTMLGNAMAAVRAGDEQPVEDRYNYAQGT